jgi:hypothetical protein
MEARNANEKRTVNYLTEQNSLLGNTCNDLENQLTISRANCARLNALIDDEQKSNHIIQTENANL